MINNKKKYDIKILNLSLGTPANNPVKSDPMVRAVEEAMKAGIVVVVAAGNSGPDSKTILSPGNSPSAITVGAVDDRKAKAESAYTIAPFSSRGPTKEGLRKPDVVAPGVSIKSLANGEGFKTLSGTSMATPVVSGSLALLLSQNKDLSPKELKSQIMKSSVSLNDRHDNQGAGVVNLSKLFGKVSEEETPKRARPVRRSRPARRTRPTKQKPESKPLPISVIPSESADVKEQSIMTDGLIILLFLILILIRVI